jgi:hypothetical protein
MDRAQLILDLTNNLAAKTVLTLPQFTAIINSAAKEDKDALMVAVNAEKGEDLFKLLHKLIKESKFLTAQAAVNQKIVNDKIDIDDIVDMLK